MAKPWKLQAVQSQRDRKWYVRLCGGNGEIVMRSKGYPTMEAAKELCDGVQAASIAVVQNPDVVQPVGWVLQPHKGKDGQWYNRLRTSGYDLMWSEGYARVDSAQRACEKCSKALVVTLEPLAAAAPKHTSAAQEYLAMR